MFVFYVQRFAFRIMLGLPLENLKSKIMVIVFQKIGQILGAAIIHCSLVNPIRPRALSSSFFVRTRNCHFTFRWHVTCRPNQVRRLVYTGDIYIRSWDLYKPNQATLHPAPTRDKVKTPCSVIQWTPWNMTHTNTILLRKVFFPNKYCTCLFMITCYYYFAGFHINICKNFKNNVKWVEKNVNNY